jgi:hypothetical protein
VTTVRACREPLGCRGTAILIHAPGRSSCSSGMHLQSQCYLVSAEGNARGTGFRGPPACSASWQLPRHAASVQRWRSAVACWACWKGASLSLAGTKRVFRCHQLVGMLSHACSTCSWHTSQQPTCQKWMAPAPRGGASGGGWSGRSRCCAGSRRCLAWRLLPLLLLLLLLLRLLPHLLLPLLPCPDRICGGSLGRLLQRSPGVDERCWW